LLLRTSLGPKGACPCRCSASLFFLLLTTFFLRRHGQNPRQWKWTTRSVELSGSTEGSVTRGKIPANRTLLQRTSRGHVLDAAGHGGMRSGRGVATSPRHGGILVGCFVFMLRSRRPRRRRNKVWTLRSRRRRTRRKIDRMPRSSAPRTRRCKARRAPTNSARTRRCRVRRRCRSVPLPRRLLSLCNVVFGFDLFLLNGNKM